MSDKKSDAAPAEGEGAKHAAKDAAHGDGGGGLKAWLPLIVSIVLMPVLAFATTKFLLIPKIAQAREAGHADGEEQEEGKDGKEAKEPKEGKKEGGKESKEKEAPKEKEKEAGKPKEGGKEGKEGKDAKGHASKKKQAYPITKVIVNVAGTSGSRYLMTSFTLAGTHNDFKNILEDNKDQLLDLANTAMASKTIADLEKPGARNQLRAELISIFNNALGKDVVQEIYFTEFAVQ